MRQEITQEFVQSLFNELKVPILDLSINSLERYHAIQRNLDGLGLKIKGSFDLAGNLTHATYTVWANVPGFGTVDILYIYAVSNKEHAEIKGANAIYPLEAYEQ